MSPVLRVLTLAAVVALAGCPDENTTNPPADGSTSDLSDSQGDGGGDVTPQTCTSDDDCTASGECMVATCNTVTGKCEEGPRPDGIQCTSTDPCVENTVCSNGQCAGGTAVPADCGTAVCGTDACGNSCGTCDTGETCNNGVCEPEGGDCGDITFEGCCSADLTTMTYCNQGSVEAVPCSQDGNVCSWISGQGFYDCAGSFTPPDDPASFPVLCPGEECPITCDDIECGFACGEDCGKDCGSGSFCNNDNQCQACECGADCDVQCGDGQFCSPDLTCEECTCGPGEICLADGSCGIDACAEGVSFEGCCYGDVLVWCENGESSAINCGPNPSCGWSADNSYYDCGTDGTEDPSGSNPLSCGIEPPDQDPDQVEVVEEVPDVVESEPDAGDAEVTEEVIDDTVQDVGPEVDEDAVEDTADDATDAADDATPDTGDDATPDTGDDATPDTGDDATDDAGTDITAAAATYTEDAQPIYAAKCTPCHTGSGFGGHNIGTTYDDAFLDSYHCAGLTKGQCTIVRIKEGSMPQGAGCTGDPAQDAGNAACLTQAEQDTIQAWVDAGMPE